MPIHTLVLLVALSIFLLELADWDLLLIVEVEIFALFSLAADFLKPVDADFPLSFVLVSLRGERVDDRLHLIEVHVLAAHEMLVDLFTHAGLPASEAIVRLGLPVHWWGKLAIVATISWIPVLHRE